MRTIEVSDPLFLKAQRAAEHQSVTLRELVESALSRFLRELSNDPLVDLPTAFRLRDASVGGEGVQSGIREGDWADLLYEGRGA